MGSLSATCRSGLSVVVNASPNPVELIRRQGCNLRAVVLQRVRWLLSKELDVYRTNIEEPFKAQTRCFSRIGFYQTMFRPVP